ncbi:multidrug effflux MFS transporter [Tenacibaculum sp. C7A-26P2]|uniref:multidrug effflux MFS transporter n=1 Tax=Tenacibaculum sp. C7A-26P2 TaxID=3447504 RepID=UPI003F847E71
MQKNNYQSKLEFIILMASLMSLVALSIDALLPALNKIGKAINFPDPKDSQLLITMIFLGLGVGQLIAGPISDSIGRKPVVYIGFILFIIASYICVSARTIDQMIFGRILQGVSLSAPRTISVAMIRDTFSGNYMAKIMSFIVVIFLLVPMIAPALGKIILELYGWKSIFYFQVLFGFLVTVWLWKRQPETLNFKYKKPLSLRLFINGLKEFLKNKQAVIFTIISGLITSSFMVYLSSSQHIFEEQYNLSEEFPLIFAGLSLSLGLATFLNGNLVIRFGMLKLVRISTIILVFTSIIYIFLFFEKSNPSIEILFTFFSFEFFAVGFLFGNLRALAMEPLGHIAGIGAALNGFLSTIVAVPIAGLIGQWVDETAMPLFYGFSICGILSLILLAYLRKHITI